MGLGLFLLPTIGGYWLLTHLNYTRYRTFPISEIVSARLFFPEAYELFREQADESLEDV